MTSPGRPPRSSSSSRNRITIRVTDAERELLEKAASPGDLSQWVRETLFKSERVLAIDPDRLGAQDLVALHGELHQALANLRDLTSVEAIRPLVSAVQRMFGVVGKMAAHMEQQQRLLNACSHISAKTGQ